MAATTGTRLAHYPPMVPNRDEAIVQALTRAWQRIRDEDPGVPPVTFYLTGGRASSCATASWEEEQPVLRVNLQRGGVNLTGAAIMAWLLHHAAHASAGTTASSEGRWHSEAYRDAAEAPRPDSGEGADWVGADQPGTRVGDPLPR